MAKFVIAMPADRQKFAAVRDVPAYAVNDPINGWIYTILLSAATRFDSEREARTIINCKYPSDKDILVIAPVSK